MAELTLTGVKARIAKHRLELTEEEAIDLFFMYPNNVQVNWVNGNIVGVEVSGLNVKFKIKS